VGHYSSPPPLEITNLIRVSFKPNIMK